MRINAKVFLLAGGLMLAAAAAAQSGESTDPGAQSGPGGQSMPGEQFGQMLQRAARAYQAQDIEAWVEATRQLHELRPYNQDFMRHLVVGHAQLGNLSEAYNMMFKMQQQGLAEDWDAIDAVEPLREHQVYDHVSRLMSEAGEPFGDVRTWSTLGSDYAMPEAMAFDSERGRLLVGTVRDGLIIASENGEDWETLASPETVPQLQSIFDLAVDAERGHLWVATGAAPQYRGEAREDEVRSALLRLDLESGELQQDYPISAGSGRNMLGALALAGDGTVFAADAQAPVVYRLAPGADAVQPYFGHSNFTSLRGMALNADDSLLYIADYELGLFVLDAAGGKQAWQLGVPENFNAGGIDGLNFWNGHLIAIQNGISPQRVVRLELSENGLGVTNVAPLAAAQEAFDTPTFGAMHDQDLYFFAGSHWQHVDPNGEPLGTLPEVPIMRVDVDNASVQVVGEEIMEELLRRSKEGDQASPEG
jgi:sugar lactone lactonase YvrE